MTNAKKAVELADGWEYADKAQSVLAWDGLIIPAEPALDALAAQLVRQADALGYEVVIWSDLTRVRRKGDSYLEYMKPQTDDRTMNTIKAIVDSGVLE